MPALLNATGEPEVAASGFEAAGRDFGAVTTLRADRQSRGEAHFNAYRAALERPRLRAGLRALAPGSLS